MFIMKHHPSDWTKFFDERNKHKGSGVVRDILMTIGKTFKKGTTKVAKKTEKGAAEKVGKKLSKVVVERAFDKIQQKIRKRRPRTPEQQPISTLSMAPIST